jgi:hypothetical protein
MHDSIISQSTENIQSQETKDKLIAQMTVERHAQLTPDQVYALRIIYPSHVYLHLLLLSMKRAGWQIHIQNVRDFCEKWGFAERTFYWAKAKLVRLGLLIEEVSNG